MLLYCFVQAFSQHNLGVLACVCLYTNDLKGVRKQACSNHLFLTKKTVKIQKTLKNTLSVIIGKMILFVFWGFFCITNSLMKRKSERKLKKLITNGHTRQKILLDSAYSSPISPF